MNTKDNFLLGLKKIHSWACSSAYQDAPVDKKVSQLENLKKFTEKWSEQQIAFAERNCSIIKGRVFSAFTIWADTTIKNIDELIINIYKQERENEH